MTLQALLRHPIVTDVEAFAGRCGPCRRGRPSG
jgi:hypothetical protein